MLLLAAICTLFGCGHSDLPEEVWCDTGTGPGKVVYPRAISYDAKSDTFYIVDRTAQVQRIDHDGKPMEEWEMPDNIIGKPVGLSVGPDGNLYVPDTHYQRIIVYDPAGKEVRRWGSAGKGPGQFIFPTDIAFDDKGNCYVSEYGDHDRIQVFDMHGNYLRQFGSFGDGDGQFRRPQIMAIVGDTMYITDACNHRICVFKTDGTFIRNMGHVGGGLGEFRFPYGLDIDGKGLATWGHPGRGPGEMAYPWAVVVDKRGRIVAVDGGNNRLQVFEF